MQPNHSVTIAMMLLPALLVLMCSLGDVSAGQKNHGMGLTHVNQSASIKHEEMLRSTSKHGNPIRLSIKADFNKLKEDQDRVASEKEIEEKGSGGGSGSDHEVTSDPKNKTSTIKDNQKTTKKDIKVLLCKFMKLMSGAKGSCKNNELSKKAMIWPKKMLPVLEKMLGNKDGGSESESSPLPFEDGDAENSFGTSSTSKLIGNGLHDNWDYTGGNTNIAHLHHKKRKRKLHRMLKMLKAMMNGRGVGGNWDDDLAGDYGRPKMGSASYRLLKQLLNQMLGGTDRKDVLREMLEAFVNANGVDKNGEEAHEALDELMGRKSLFQLNDMMQNPEQNLGLMSPFAPSETMGMSQDQSPADPDEMIHAQMLPNGAIAPMTNPAALQRPPAIRQAGGARLLGQAQGRAVLVSPAGIMPRPVVASPPRMFAGLNEAAADQRVLRQQQLANEQLRRIKAAEERGIMENMGDEGELNEVSQREQGYFQPQSPRAGYQDADLETNRVLGLRPSFRSDEQASVISSVSRPEIEDSLQQQPTMRSTRSRFEGSDFYANHNGLAAALENDSLLRRFDAFRRGKVLKGHNSSKGHSKISTKSQDLKGLSKIKTLK